jgi:O-acetyl-ADP-ribose deacetylase (regulator of RNase III)
MAVIALRVEDDFESNYTLNSGSLVNMLWRASEWSIRQSVRNAMTLAHEKGFQSIAFPLIGAGSGGFNQERTKAIMEDELRKVDFPIEVTLVVYRR